MHFSFRRGGYRRHSLLRAIIQFKINTVKVRHNSASDSLAKPQVYGSTIQKKIFFYSLNLPTDQIPFPVRVVVFHVHKKNLRKAWFGFRKNFNFKCNVSTSKVERQWVVTLILQLFGQQTRKAVSSSDSEL
jgi:hypothetical protein